MTAHDAGEGRCPDCAAEKAARRLYLRPINPDPVKAIADEQRRRKKEATR